jgi:hypothetical protein
VRENRSLDSSSVVTATFGRFWPILVSVAILVGLSKGAAAWADGPNQVALIVVHGDGSVITRCVEFAEDEISGYDVLDRSGLDLNIEPSGGVGAAVCRLDNEGCTFPAEPCFCQCAGGGAACIYWSYWHFIEGSWQYSGLGTTNYTVGHGDVEGWVWGIGTIGGAAPPPAIPFEAICTPSTPTSTPTATATPAPAPTSTPTNTPPPTYTPEPPTIAYFQADRTTINPGERVTLTWDLSQARAAYLRYEDVEEGVVAPGGKTLSPTQTTIYTLVARSDGGEAVAQVTITVLPAPGVAEASGTPTASATPIPLQASPPSATPAPAGAAPTPVVGTLQVESPTPLASDTPLPPLLVEPSSTLPASPTFAPTATARPSATPAAVVEVSPGSAVHQKATPPALLRDAPSESGLDTPAVVLGVVGMVALAGGLVGMVILLLAARRGVR